MFLRALQGEIRLHPGVRRLGFGLMLLWFVFWTFAYVMRPHRSDNHRLPEKPFSLLTQVALVLTAGFVGPWVVAAFRPDSGRSPRRR